MWQACSQQLDIARTRDVVGSKTVVVRSDLEVRLNESAERTSK